ncbi:SGNH/GDSL hydrolase family protein [Streptomyces sp. NPDC051561]|uniref:SGNH/GDSL hydrolase family protein n=1 Tax=Streptomyces sp. NPDC051561 TaxID=3365658 RepID=UPI003792D87F
MVGVLTLLWATGCANPEDEPGNLPPVPEVVGAAQPGGAPPRTSAPARPTDVPRPNRAPRTSPAAPSEPREKSPVLYLGDSLAMENQKVLGRRIEESGRATVHSAPYSGTTLCDYLTAPAVRSLVPPQDKAAALVGAQRPRVVVLQFWGNSWGYTPCMKNIVQGSAEYYERYIQDARTLTAQIAAAARAARIPRPRIVWVLQGPDAFSTDRTSRVNDLYRAQASAAGDTVADAGRAVSAPGERYVWQQRLPCNAEERAVRQACDNGLALMHREDDPLHFCRAPTTPKPQPCPAPSPGIERYSKAIAATVDSSLRRLG